MPSWWVGCKVRLKIRLEDNSLGILPPIPSPTAPGSGPESFGSGSTSDIIDGASAFLSIGQDIVPTNCSVEINNYRKADTAKITIPLSRLPVDPRLIRAMTVQVFGGVYSPDEWAAANGTRGAPGLLLPDAPTALTGVPDSFGGMTNELFRGFCDRVDMRISATEQSVEFTARDLTGELLDAEIPPNSLRDLPGFLRLDEAVQLLLTGDGLASIETDQRVRNEIFKPLGRRARQLRRDAKKDDAAAADADANGDAAGAAAARASAQAKRVEANGIKGSAQGLPPLSRRFGLPGFRGTLVVNEVVSALGVPVLLPTLDEIRPKAWVDSRGTSRKGRKRGAGGKQKISFWDFIWDLVTSAGFILFMRPPPALSLSAVQIVISNPRTYYRQATAAGDVTPGPTGTRTFTFGLNAEDIKFSRNLKGTSVPTIQVNGFDSSTGIRYSGYYPALDKNNRPTPTGKGDRAEIKVINADQVVGGSPQEITAALTRAAASIYEQLARGDFEVQVKTRSLSALPQFVQRGINADLFALRPKDPIQIEIPARDPTTGVISSALILAEASVATRVAQAQLAGLPQEAAIKIGIASSSQYIQKEFRTRTVTLVWGMESGWDVTCDAINYLDVRDSIQITDARTGVPSA